uniref:Centriole, cilia and spindle associated protein n=2 Tax=Canis lupus familiaris TaxID=9615 RepID=A0A8I3MG87_CANLF
MGARAPGPGAGGPGGRGAGGRGPGPGWQARRLPAPRALQRSSRPHAAGRGPGPGARGGGVRSRGLRRRLGFPAAAGTRAAAPSATSCSGGKRGESRPLRAAAPSAQRAGRAPRHPGALEVKDLKEKPEQQIRTKETDKLLNSTEPRQQQSALLARGNRKAVKSPQRSSSRIKENKHPFALYGWGEKQMDTGSQKTHNVCASASVHEIHESALRAKNRRQVEKRKLVTQRQRAHSVEVEKNRRVKPSASENPWMTEYMRCYSARA